MNWSTAARLAARMHSSSEEYPGMVATLCGALPETTIHTKTHVGITLFLTPAPSSGRGLHNLNYRCKVDCTRPRFRSPHHARKAAECSGCVPILISERWAERPYPVQRKRTVVAPRQILRAALLYARRAECSDDDVVDLLPTWVLSGEGYMRVLYFVLAILLATVPGSAQDFVAAQANWNSTKRAADQIIHENDGTEFYCGCEYELKGTSSGRGRITSTEECGYRGPPTHRSRADRVEWEHIVPASLVPARRFGCWALGGRAECERTSAEAARDDFRPAQLGAFNCPGQRVAR